MRDPTTPFRIPSPSEQAKILEARQAVWRSYFANEREALEALLPEDTLAFNAGDPRWLDRGAVLAGAADLARSSARLVELRFDRTEMRLFGDVAVLWTTYRWEIEIGGRREAHQGRGTEIFVSRDGRWQNPGWHLEDLR